eukprot:121352-Pelagomonas_calceolata.AAC.1
MRQSRQHASFLHPHCCQHRSVQSRSAGGPSGSQHCAFNALTKAESGVPGARSEGTHLTAAVLGTKLFAVTMLRPLSERPSVLPIMGMAC